MSGEDGGHWASGEKASDWAELAGPLGLPGGWGGRAGLFLRPLGQSSGKSRLVGVK